MFGFITKINEGLHLIINIITLVGLREKIKYGTDYFFEEYRKQVTIYKDGHGILATTFKVKVLNPEKLTKIKRKINISDGKTDAGFTTLKQMLRAKKENRFNSLGFWYRSDDDIVSGANEFYFSDTDDTKEDQASKADNKELRWIFNINSGKIKKGHCYTIRYAVCVPGMFPIKAGKFDKEKSPFEKYGDFCSSLRVTHAIKKVIYTVALEKGIKLSKDLQCAVIDHNKDGSEKKIPIAGEMNDSVFYDKYTYTMKNPRINSCIKINWNIKGNKE